MSSFKKAQVVMLPTNKKAILFLKDDLLQSYNEFDESFITHNLYVISDDKIKEGDWVLTTLHNKIEQVLNNKTSLEFYKQRAKKIIATPDTSLTIPYMTNYGSQRELNGVLQVKSLPQLSQQFIEKYIESYNKGEITTDVLVEYKYKGKEYVDEQDAYGYDKQVVKVNPKDNTIIIKEIKDIWNREELIQLLHQIVNDSHCLSNRVKFPSSNNCAEFTNNWIKENL